MGKDSFFNTLGEKVREDAMLTFIDTGQTFAGASIPFGVKTGIPTLDLALGRPGWAAGRIVEAYGFEGSGKTTLGLHALANVQKLGGIGIFIDSELTFDPRRAAQIGVQLNYGDNFFRIEANSVDSGFRAVEKITESVSDSKESRPIVAVYDSVTGSQLEYDKDREIGVEQRTGHEAKVIRQGMRAITSKVSASKMVLILVNHGIAKVARTPYAKQSQAAGGHAIKLFSSTRCELTKIGKIREGKDGPIIGAKTQILIEKSKLGGLSYDKIEVPLLNASGFDTLNNLLDACELSGLAERPANGKVYTLQAIEKDRTISKADWPVFVEESGGLDAVYNAFYDWCFEKNIMTKYS